MVVHITRDLMMSSTASLAARQAGFKFKFVASWERALHFILENDVKYLLVDLQASELDIDEVTTGLKQVAPERRPQSIAYAQHVEVELLEKANNASFDQVLTRGQAHHGLAELLAG